MAEQRVDPWGVVGDHEVSPVVLQIGLTDGIVREVVDHFDDGSICHGADRETITEVITEAFAFVSERRPL